MGEACSSACADSGNNDFNNRKRYTNMQYSNVPDEEKEVSYNDQQINNEMAKEVILLSTRNANLEQELDETNKTLKKLKKNIKTNLEILDDNKLGVDILKICKILNIKTGEDIIYNDDNNDNLDHVYDGNQETNSKIYGVDTNIYWDILEMDETENKKMKKYFDAFNDNKQLFKLLKYLKQKNDLKNVYKIIIMQLYKSYYTINNGQEEELDEIMVYNFCTENFENIPSQIITKINEIMKQEVTLQNQYESVINDS